MFKLLKYAVILVLLAVVGLVVAAYFGIDYAAKRVVEKEGSSQLNVPVTLSSASVKWTSGGIGFKDLTVGSPAGFTEPHVLTIGGLGVTTAGFTHLRDKPIHVTAIMIDGPTLTIEQKGLKFNFKELANGLPDSGSASPKTANDNPVKLIIDSLTITNATVKVVPDAGGVAGGAITSVAGNLVGNDLATKAGGLAQKQAGKAVGPRTITLPAMDPIKDIGKAQGGVEVKDVVMAVVQAMAAQAIKDNNLPIDPGLLSGGVAGVQQKLTGAVQDQVQQRIKALPGAGDLFNKAVGGGK